MRTIAPFRLRRIALLISALALACCTCAADSTTAQTVRHHRIAEPAAPTDLDRAQDAIANQDFATARPLLESYTRSNASDYRGWYTLGYLDSATGDKSAAVADYKRALAIKPDLFEANLNLGLLLAESKDTSGAIDHLRRATEETPQSADPAERNRSLARAWFALGFNQATRSDYPAAAAAFNKAAQLEPSDPDYRQAAAAAPHLSECGEHVLGAFTIVHDCAVAASSMSVEHLQARVAADPNDRAAAAQLAHDYVEAKQFAKAEPLLRSLVAASPRDAEVNYRYGFVLMHLQQWKPAEQYIARAINLDPKLQDAYGDLAIVAAENADYQLSLQALDARAKFAPESAGTYFLRATDLDHLQDIKGAAANYRAFLANSHGELPDREWQARHRLIALDPGYRKESKK